MVNHLYTVEVARPGETYWSLVGDPEWTNYRVETRIHFGRRRSFTATALGGESGLTAAGLIVRRQGQARVSFWVVGSADSLVGYAWAIDDPTKRIHRTYKYQYPKRVDSDGTVKLAVEAKGDLFVFYVNGADVSCFTDNTCPKGRAGVWAVYSSQGDSWPDAKNTGPSFGFSEFKITKLDTN
jgi:hypothetical protein